MKPLSSHPIISVIIPTYNRPKFLRVALGSLLAQTYPHIEIIVVKNGSPHESETSQYLNDVASGDNRVRVIEYAERQWSPDDPLKFLDRMNEAMVQVATGELVFPLADDDFLAEDYFDKMVALFRENPHCTTAAGLQVEVDALGHVSDGAVAASFARNKRPRYMPGHQMVMDWCLSQTPTMLYCSTWLFTIRRDDYIRLGGITRGEHYSSLCGVVPFGITGFDETAFFYHRQHAEQQNKELIESGDDCGHYAVQFFRTMKVEERWTEWFGADCATTVIPAVVARIYGKMMTHAEMLYRHGSLDAAARQFELCLTVEPDAVDVHRRLGDIRLRKWWVKEAAQHYRRCGVGDSAARLWLMIAMRFVHIAASALRATRAVRVPGSTAKRLFRLIPGGSAAKPA